MIAALDDSVGQILGKLKELNLDEKTLVIFTSDNGPWYGGSTGGLRGMKGNGWEGGIRVPMFAYWKGKIHPGQVIDEMVTTLDFTATTLALGGGVIPPEFDGIDLIPRLTGMTLELSRHQPMFWDFYTGQAIREGDWKLWRKDDTTVLFNIAQDPAELTNLAYQKPKLVTTLTEKLDKWVDSLPATARYDPEKRGKNMVSALGGAPADVKPDPRYLIPYENPVATPYPAAVVTPGGPTVAPVAAKTSSSAQSPRKAGPQRLGNPKDAMRKNNRTQRDPSKLFQRRDQNQDGFVTLKEFIGDPTNRNVPALTKMFRSRDANNDQRLTLEEMQNPAE